MVPIRGCLSFIIDNILPSSPLREETTTLAESSVRRSTTTMLRHTKGGFGGGDIPSPISVTHFVFDTESPNS